MDRPCRTLPDNLCFWTIALTWAFYAGGALYIAGPALAWVLAALAGLSLYLGPAARLDLRATCGVPAVVWAWIVGMAGMLLALWVGHVGWGLGVGEVVKSSVGWAKGWALAALFPFAGAVLPIRRAPLVRAQCIVGLCTLALLPFMLLAPTLGLPEKVFVSPLQAVGGPGPEYFTVYLYTLDPENWTARWQFFAPWSPFAGLIGVVLVLFALEEPSRFWRWCGIAAGLAMIWFSKSRMSLVALAVCAILPRLMPLLSRSTFWVWAAGAAASMAVLGDAALRAVDDAVSGFKGARASSTRVRETLQRIAFDRWGREAPWFGHGTVERGPHIVEHMPIGSHHTWFGLLFVKGLAGVLALLLPVACQFWVTVADAVRGRRGRLPFGLMLQIVILTFGENLEIEVYLLWPAFVLFGIHAREISLERLAAHAVGGAADAPGAATAAPVPAGVTRPA